MASEAMHVVANIFILLAVIFIIGMFAGKLANYLRIPDVAIYILAGIVVGPVLHLVHLPEDSAVNMFILVLGAALILFDGGIGISFKVLKQVWPTIVMLSVPGVIITAVVTAFAAHYFLGIPMIYAWLLAAIISSTDPATLIPVFRQVTIRDRVRQTVESESAFNDATGSILTLSILAAALSGQAISIPDSAVTFLKMAVGGLAIGLIIGWLSAVLMSETRSGWFNDYPAVAYTTAAIASYYLADRFGMSGFMATFTAGVMLGNHKSLKLHVSDHKLQAVHHFYEGITLMFRMLIFVLLGTHVNFETLQAYWLPGIGVVAVFMFIARPLTVMASTLPDRRAKWSWNEIFFMFWVRETGVIPAALVGIIAATGVAHIEVISSVTFLAILITIVLQASTTGWMAKKTGLIVEKKKS